MPGSTHREASVFIDEFDAEGLVEHLRLTQADILAYLTNPAYRAPAWPQDYWPPREAEATKELGEERVSGFRQINNQLA